MICGANFFIDCFNPATEIREIHFQASPGLNSGLMHKMQMAIKANSHFIANFAHTFNKRDNTKKERSKKYLYGYLGFTSK